MAPKLLCGLLLTLVGLVFSSFCFIYAVMNPCNYNGINGLLGSFFGYPNAGAVHHLHSGHVRGAHPLLLCGVPQGQ